MVERLAPKPLENNALRATRSTCALKIYTWFGITRPPGQHRSGFFWFCAATAGTPWSG